MTIVARRIGYAQKTASFQFRTGAITQNFTLTSAAAQLEGIVVTALGIEKEKKALGVAQQTIDSTLLTQGARSTNLVSDLSGKIAGINVTSASTQGGSARIVIRGATSIGGNNQPLFVVDGVPIDNSNYAKHGAARLRWIRLQEHRSDLNRTTSRPDLRAQGSNAAALYGARGERRDHRDH